jgi:hypothetical protein
MLGKLLLPANVRLDWKVIVRYKHSRLLGLGISNEGKKFYEKSFVTLTPGVDVIKLFFSMTLTLVQDKLGCLFLRLLFSVQSLRRKPTQVGSLVNYFENRHSFFLTNIRLS